MRVHAGLRTRPARPDDLDGLVALCLRARAESAVGAQLCSDDPEQLRRQLAVLAAVPGGHVEVAELEGRPVGLLLTRVVGPGPLAGTLVLAVEAVYVEPDHRRRGVGHALLAVAAMLAEQAGASDLYATPLPGSRGMQRFLACLGFAPAGPVRVVPTATLRRRLVEDAVPSGRPRGLADLVVLRRRARSRLDQLDQPASAG